MSYSDPGARDVIDRATIRMPYVSDERRLSVESWPVVTPHCPLWLRRITERMGQQFHRETRFDVAPYLAEHPSGQHVMLLPSIRRVVSGGQLIAGTVGIADAQTAPLLAWAYVHPYERGLRLVDRAWLDITRRYPNIRMDGDPANTPAGDALLGRLAKSANHPGSGSGNLDC